jgi:hypothetical protein
VPTKIVLKVDFLKRDFERDHLAEKSNRTKMGQKIHCAREDEKVLRALLRPRPNSIEVGRSKKVNCIHHRPPTKPISTVKEKLMVGKTFDALFGSE